MTNELEEPAILTSDQSSLGDVIMAPNHVFRYLFIYLLCLVSDNWI